MNTLFHFQSDLKVFPIPFRIVSIVGTIHGQNEPTELDCLCLITWGSNVPSMLTVNLSKSAGRFCLCLVGKTLLERYQLANVLKVLDGYEVSSGGRVINVCSSHNLRNLMYNEETTIVVNKKLEVCWS